MTGDPTRDHEPSEHRFATPDVPWTDDDYAAHEADKEAALAEREAEMKERWDAAHEKAKAARAECDCYDGYGGIEDDCPIHGEGEGER